MSTLLLWAIPPPRSKLLMTNGEVQVSPTPVGYRMSVLPSGTLRRAVHGRVRQAEIATESTCAWCGEAGHLWTGSRLHVACAKHRRRDAIAFHDWRQLRNFYSQQDGRGCGDPAKKAGNRDE